MAAMRLHPAALGGLWFAALTGFVVAALFAANHDTFPSDLWFAHRVQDIDGAAFARAFDWTEDFADLPLLAAVMVGAALTLLVSAGWETALLLLVSAGGRLLNSGLKEIIERPRPTPDLVEVTCEPNSTFSFPSGHSEGAFVLYGLIFYFATIYLADARLRVPVQAVCVWIVLVTGIERVHTGCHWPSDVLGGFYAGSLVLAVVIVVHRLVISSRKE
jgi:undecaprenyl-diphosphatase